MERIDPPPATAGAELKNMEDGANDQQTLMPHLEKHKGSSAEYIKDIIYGGQDGIVSTFVALVATTGGKQNVYTVTILAAAKLIASCLSMAVCDYLATDAEASLAHTEKKREKWEYDNNLEGEVDEMVELYVKKGVPEDVARRVMTILSRNKTAFVDIMMAEELGIPTDQEDDSPWKHALATFIAFLAFGIIPLASYIIICIIKAANGHTYQKVALALAIVLTFFTLVAMGIYKAKVTGSSYWKSIAWTAGLGVIVSFVGWFTAWGLAKVTHVNTA